MQDQLNIRPVHQDDIPNMVYTINGIVVEQEGEILGHAAVVYSSPLQAVSDIDEKLLQYPRIIVKAVKEFRNILNRYESVIYAYPDERHDTAPGFLKHVGFEEVSDEVYRYGNK